MILQSLGSFISSVSCGKSVADPKICPRGDPMTRELVARSGDHLFLTIFNRGRGAGASGPPPLESTTGNCT